MDRIKEEKSIGIHLTKKILDILFSLLDDKNKFLYDNENMATDNELEILDRVLSKEWDACAAGLPPLVKRLFSTTKKNREV